MKILHIPSGTLVRYLINNINKHIIFILEEDEQWFNDCNLQTTFDITKELFKDIKNEEYHFVIFINNHMLQGAKAFDRLNEFELIDR